MSECEQADRLGAYHDGELPDGTRMELEDHLRRCPACMAELARIRRLTRLLGCVPRPEMPLAAVGRVHRAVDRLAGAGVVRMAEALAAVAVAVLLVSLIGLAWFTPAPAPPAAIPVWEVQAVGQPSAASAPSDSQELLAMWMAQDLSRGDEGD